MDLRSRPFTDWATPLAFLAVAIAFIAADPAHLALRLAEWEIHAWRGIRNSASAPHLPGFLFGQLLFLAPAGAALTLLFALARLAWAGAFALTAIAAVQAASWLQFANGRELFDSANASVALLLVAGVGYLAFA
ncbi:MAG TPA: hypothetical protein VGI20_05890, partial [Rhizomicrobium sp.]